MDTYKKLEAEVNAIKAINAEAGNRLHEQLSFAQNAQWSFDELSRLIKVYYDIADQFFSEDEDAHASVRNIQDGIIKFYAK